MKTKLILFVALLACSPMINAHDEETSAITSCACNPCECNPCYCTDCSCTRCPSAEQEAQVCETNTNNAKETGCCSSDTK